MTKKRKKIVIKRKKDKNSDNTELEQSKSLSAKERQLSGLETFKPGQSGNPKGRPKGSRNKLGEAFLKDFLKEWEEGGIEALKRVRTYDPATFIKVAASILPKEININEENATLENFLEKFQTIEEIDAFIKGVTTIGAGDSAEEEESPASLRSQSDILH